MYLLSGYGDGQITDFYTGKVYILWHVKCLTETLGPVEMCLRQYSLSWFKHPAEGTTLSLCLPKNSPLPGEESSH